MKNEKIVGVQFKPGRKHCLFALVAAFLCFHPRPLGSETLTLSTYYPAPYGGYVAILTTGGSATNPVNTVLARDGGKVGIGTVSPASKLSVSGGIQMGDDTAACTASKNGTLRWHAGAVEVCKGGVWTASTGSLPNCDNALTPDYSTNKPCNALIYRCPEVYTANGRASGDWANFQCLGQIQMAPTCLVIVFPEFQSYPCDPAGRSPLYNF